MGKRSDPGRDREIAAAYASGLSLRACAAKFGIARDTARAAIVRAGTPLRRAGRSRKLTADAAAVKDRYEAGGSTDRFAPVHGGRTGR